MNKIKIQDSISFSLDNGVTISELNQRYEDTINRLYSKYDDVSDIKIGCESGYYNEYENYFQDIVVSFKRYETDEEYSTRIRNEKWHKEQANIRMKKFVDENKEAIIKYLKECNEDI